MKRKLLINNIFDSALAFLIGDRVFLNKNERNKTPFKQIKIELMPIYLFFRQYMLHDRSIDRSIIIIDRLSRLTCTIYLFEENSIAHLSQIVGSS